MDGSTITMGVCDGVACGLSVIAENPVYVQGDYNANAGNCAGCNGPPPAVNAFNNAFVAAAVMGDAVTLLSNRWNDVNSFAFPYNTGGRNAITTNYRTAIVGGKGIPFLNPNGTYQDYGTDGGTHNFLRYIENWGGQELNYKGSIVSFYYSHQAGGHIQVLKHRVQPAKPRLQLPDGVSDSELVAAAHADVPRHQHHRLYTAHSADAVERFVAPQHHRRLPLPPGAAFVLITRRISSGSRRPDAHVKVRVHRRRRAGGCDRIAVQIIHRVTTYLSNSGHLYAHLGAFRR